MNSDLDRHAVIILGMHRSGTSALSHLCSLLGAYPGENLIEPAPDNPGGFWENKDVVQIHDALLHQLNSRWDATLPLPEKWWQRSDIYPFRQRIVALLEEQFADQPLWVIKDPRMCLLLPLWQSILQDLEVLPHFLIVNRQPSEIVKSLQKRNEFDEQSCYLLYLHHYLTAELHSRSCARAVVNYADLLGDWRNSLSALTNAADIPWQTSPLDIETDIDGIIDAGLRHHSNPEFVAEGDLSKLVQRTAQTLTNMALSGEKTASRRSLDRIGKGLYDIEDTLSPWRLELTRQSNALRQLIDVLKPAQADSTSLADEIDRADRLGKQIQQERQRQSDELASAQDYASDLENNQIELQQEIATLTLVKQELAKESEKLGIVVKEGQQEFDEERQRQANELEKAQKYAAVLEGTQLGLHEEISTLAGVKQELVKESEKLGILVKERQRELEKQDALVVVQQRELKKLSSVLVGQQKELAKLGSVIVEQQEELAKLGSVIVEQAVISGQKDELLQLQQYRDQTQADLGHYEALQLEHHHLQIHGREQVRTIRTLQLQLAEISADRQRQSHALAEVLQSRSWKLSAPVRALGRMIHFINDSLYLMWRLITSPRDARELIYKARIATGNHGLFTVVSRLPEYLQFSRRRIAARERESGLAVIQDTSPQVWVHPDQLNDIDTMAVSASVVIPTYNAGDEFYWLLRKLRQQEGLREVEIVIVDSASTDDTVTLARDANCVVVEISQEEFSHSYARNLGAENATGDYLVFMVQDAYPIGNRWLYGMLQHVTGDDGVVATSCAEFCRADSDVMYDCNVDTHYRFLGCKETDRIGEYKGEDHMALRSEGQLSDVSCLISRDLFNRYGYQGDYAEDLDLGIRLIRDSNRVSMLASIKTIHSHNRPSYYYLKRSFVDVIFLVQQFDDFEIPNNLTFRGLFAAINGMAVELMAFVKNYDSTYCAKPMAEVLTHDIKTLRDQMLGSVLQGEATLPDARLTEHLAKLREAYVGDPELLTDADHTTVRAIVHGFAGRLDHFAAFAGSVYRQQDSSLREEILEMFCKTFAATVGSYIGFLYLNRASLDEESKCSIEAVGHDLQAGI